MPNSLAAAERDPTLSRLRVLKRLAPGRPGTRKLSLRYGDALVCVRHRTDLRGQFRYTTVELLVERTPITPRTDRTVVIRVEQHEASVRTLLRAAGAVFDPASRTWRLSRRVAGVLNLLGRVGEG